jgi:hypothetical protein
MKSNRREFPAKKVYNEVEMKMLLGVKDTAGNLNDEIDYNNFKREILTRRTKVQTEIGLSRSSCCSLFVAASIARKEREIIMLDDLDTAKNMHSLFDMARIYSDTLNHSEWTRETRNMMKRILAPQQNNFTHGTSNK